MDARLFGPALETLATHLGDILVAVRSDAGGGSGTVWGSDGLVITNHHVAPGSEATVELADGRVFPATIAARDPERDLAALRIDAAGLTAAVPAPAGSVRPGTLAFAIGNPWGRRGVITAGVVLGTGPAVLESGLELEDAVRAEVRLGPGNSGGPLTDAGGRVIGINSMIAGGMAVAVPAHVVERFLAGHVAIAAAEGTGMRAARRRDGGDPKPFEDVRGGAIPRVRDDERAGGGVQRTEGGDLFELRGHGLGTSRWSAAPPPARRCYLQLLTPGTVHL